MVSADGAIPDIHITVFMTVINLLLHRSLKCAKPCLTPMKSVVSVVTTILDDVCSYSRRHLDSEGVRGLEERVE